MFFLSTVDMDISPLLVIDTHHRIIDVLLAYFKTVTESTLRENFSIVYQLLDEMVDAGFPFTTEPNQLTDMIKPPSAAQKFVNAVTGKFSVRKNIHDSTSRIPWRSGAVKHINNEVYFDLIESIDCIIGSNEIMISCEVHGDVRCNSKLSGMPDMNILFNKPSMIDDVSLHRCVRIAKWRNEKVLSFVPPDGKFLLMTYRYVEVEVEVV